MKPCYDVPAMLRNLANEIEEQDKYGVEFQASVAVKKTTASPVLEEEIQVFGFGRFATMKQTLLLLTQGIQFMVDGIEEEESEDGTEEEYQ
jgi:hypothetical protein